MATQLSSHASTSAGSPKAAYHQLVAEKLVELDHAQLQVLERLEQLHQKLSTPKIKASPLQKLFRKAALQPSAGAKSIYIWGDVGRGKSMLMDLFFHTLPMRNKRRVHFHRFMQELHGSFHKFRQMQQDASHTQTDPIEQLVDKLSQDIEVLCFDELQATDVTDATLITRLFEGLMARQILVIATSNRPPAKLYTGDVQRERFDRLTQLIQSEFDVMSLDSPHDYRMRQLRGLTQTYYVGVGASADIFIRDAITHLAPEATPSELRIEVLGRVLAIATYGERIGKASFAELCEKPLGAPDYLALAESLEVLVLTDIPALTPEKRNEAKRLVMLIDALYEHRVKLICNAEALPDKLYTEGHGSFEFERTTSRLIEMQSQSYMELKKK